MAGLASGLVGIAGLAVIVCYVIVVIKMFQHNDQMMGIISLVGLLCGLGAIIALVVGWMNVGKYNIMLVMVIYTIAMLLLIPAAPMSGLLN